MLRKQLIPVKPLTYYTSKRPQIDDVPQVSKKSRQDLNHSNIVQQIPKDLNNLKAKVIMDLESQDEQLFAKFEGHDILKLLEVGWQIYNMPKIQEFLKKDQIQSLIFLEAKKIQIQQSKLPENKLNLMSASDEETKKRESSEESKSATNGSIRSNSKSNEQSECSTYDAKQGSSNGQSKEENGNARVKIMPFPEWAKLQSNIESILGATVRLEHKTDLFECRNRVLLNKIFEMKKGEDETDESNELTRLMKDINNLEKQMDELNKCFNK